VRVLRCLRAIGALLPACAPPLAAQGWDAPEAVALVRRAVDQRVAVQADSMLLSYRTRAHGFVFFLAQVGEGLTEPPRLVKADELDVEVYWQAPDRSKQVISGWRDGAFLPTDIHYHRDHLGIVTNDLVQTCTQSYPAKEIVLSGFFSAIGIWPWHEVTPAMEKRADELLDFVGLTDMKDRLMTEMSSGEARRAVIARALAHDPKALLLDEPTNSLDIQAFRELRDTMSRLANSGLTIVLVTHHLPDIITEIDRVICLKNGRVFRDGEKPQILRNDVLSELFDTPVEVTEIDGHYQMW